MLKKKKNTKKNPQTNKQTFNNLSLAAEEFCQKNVSFKKYETIFWREGGLAKTVQKHCFHYKIPLFYDP